MNRSVLGVVIALLAVACTPTTSGDPATTGSVTAPAATATKPLASPPPCGDDGYVDRGPVARLGDEQGDAAQILGIGVTPVESCERVTIEFTTRGGAPATRLGPIQIEWLEGLSVARVTFGTGIQSTALADTVLEGDLTERAYVVRGLDGALFIDVVLGAPGALRVEVTQSPASLIMEFRGAGAEPRPRPAIGSNVVVTLPAGDRVGAPLTVAGYARTPEGRVLGRISDNGGLIDERSTTAAAFIETWGAFQMTFDAVPDRPFELVVGADPLGPDAVTLILRPS